MARKDLDELFEVTESRWKRRAGTEDARGAQPPLPLEEPPEQIDVKLTKLMTGDFIPEAMWAHCPQCLDEQEDHYHGSVLVFGGRVIF